MVKVREKKSWNLLWCQLRLTGDHRLYKVASWSLLAKGTTWSQPLNTGSSAALELNESEVNKKKKPRLLLLLLQKVPILSPTVEKTTAGRSLLDKHNRYVKKRGSRKTYLIKCTTQRTAGAYCVSVLTREDFNNSRRILHTISSKQHALTFPQWEHP